MLRKVCSCFGFLLIAVNLVSAQGRPDFGRFGPPRFPGGGPGGPPGPSVFLLRMPEVRTELAVTEAQQSSVDGLISAAEERWREAMTAVNPQDFFTLSDAERQERMEAMRKQIETIDQEFAGKLKKVLSAEQQTRFAELALQRLGPVALLVPKIAEQLSLSEKQRASLRQIEEEFRPRFDGPPDFGRMEQQRREADEKRLDLLSADQKSKWTAMIGKPFEFPRPQFGGPGGMMGAERKLLAKFDRNGDKVLDQTERQAAREEIKSEGPRGGRGFGPPGGFPGGRPGGREPREPPQPGRRISPADVRAYPEAKLYDPEILRTLLLTFENQDWEQELVDFHNSDVDVPATLVVDGATYPNVGVHFRGMSSYGMIPAGYKRSLNVSLDLVDENQRLHGYKTLNLLNCHEDASCISTVLYSHIARKYIPTPQANFVRVVINGEEWGIYANVQQFNKEFLAENYQSTKGNRWKVRGSPGGGGGLDYHGDNIEDYRRRYEIKSKDTDKAWNSLIRICRTLAETPADEMPAAIEPMLDVDQLLWFLALDITLINNDGYWVRASDYSLYQDEEGRFHVIPHDMNEAFRPGMMGFGPPGGRGPGGPGRGPRRPEAEGDGPPPPRRGPGGTNGNARGGGVQLDPLIGLDDDRKPLRSKILAVPAYRMRYLQNVRTIAEDSLDWKSLGPVVAKYRRLIEDDLQADTRKLESFEAFQRVTSDEPSAAEPRGREFPLRRFADERRAFLLNLPAIREVAK